MIKSNNRPKGMSQVDWLWHEYSHFNVQNEASEVPSEHILLTEQAIADLIQEATNGGITSLTYEEDPDDSDYMRLTGTAINGETLTVVTMLKEEHITAFESRQVTQTDVDLGYEYSVGDNVLVITTNLGNMYMVAVADLEVSVSGTETTTIITDVASSVISANLKIDSNNNSASAVELKTSSNGVYANLKIDESSSGVTLETSEDGLKASIPMEGGTSIAFSQLTLDEYLALEEAVTDTVYFITDYPYIYLNGVRYGVNIVPGDYPIVSLIYDEDCMTLYYKKADGSDIQSIVLGAVSETQNGMMTADQYTDFLKLLTALGDITDIAEYVEEEVKNAAVSLEKGTASDGQVPVYLKDGNGNTLSTIYLDEENFLSAAEQRAATSDDVTAAAEQGVTVAEGEALLALTLVSGDIVYVNLAAIADIYTGTDTTTVTVTIKDYTVSAEVILPEDEQILYKSTEGLAARISVKQSSNTVTIYGKTEEDDNILGQFTLNDQLLSYTVLHDFDSDKQSQYPPSQVNGAAYDAETNPLYDGYTYIVLTLGMNTGDSSVDYSYNYYIDITSFLDEIKVSDDEDNIITKGSDGHLYATVSWIDV